MDEEKKLLSNTIFLSLDYIVVSILSFIFWSFLAKTLDKTSLGIVSTLTNLVIFISIFSTFGINTALTKLIPELQKRKGTEQAYSIIKVSVPPAFISIFLISSVFFLSTPLISSTIKVPYDAAIISAFSFIFISFFNFFGSVLYGLQKLKKNLLTNFMCISIKLILSVFLIIFGFNYSAPLLAFGLGYLVALPFRIDLKFFKAKPIKKYKNKIFYYAIPSLITSLLGSTITYTQYTILSSLKNTEITGVYTIAFTISSIIVAMSSIFSYALFPIISGLSHSTKKSKQLYLVSIVLRYATLLIFPASILLIIFSRQAVILFSEISKIDAALYLPILVPASILIGVGSVFFSTIYAIGRPKTQRNIMLVTTLIFLLLSIPLTIKYSALGMSISYLVSSFTYFILSYFCLRKYLKFKIYLSDTVKIIFSSFLIAASLQILKELISDFLLIMVFSSVILLFYFLSLYLLNFYRDEDVRLLRFFGRRLPGGFLFMCLSNLIEKKLKQKN